MANVKLYEKLEDVCLKRYTEDMNFKLEDGDTNDLYLCDSIVEHLTNGDFNDIYESPLLDNKSEEEKKNILYNITKNNSVCFPYGSSDHWTEIISYTGTDDYKFGVIKIIDNFEFLINIFNQCGEDALNILGSLKNENFNIKESIVNSLIDNIGSEEEIIELFNSDITSNVLKGKLIEAISNDIVYAE